MTIDQIIDLARDRGGFDSDNALSYHLGSKSMVSQWRTKRSHPTPPMMVRLAELAELDPELCLLELEAARYPESAAIFRSIIDKLRPVAAVLVLVFTLGGIGSTMALNYDFMENPVTKTYTEQRNISGPMTVYYGKSHFVPLFMYLAAINMILHSFLRLCWIGYTRRRHVPALRFYVTPR